MMTCFWRTFVCACGNTFEINDICESHEHREPGHEHQTTIYRYHSYVCDKLRRRGAISGGCKPGAKGVDGYATHHDPDNVASNNVHEKTFRHIYQMCGCSADIITFQSKTLVPIRNSEGEVMEQDKYMDFRGGFAGTMKHFVERSIWGPCPRCVENGEYDELLADRTDELAVQEYETRASEYESFHWDLYAGRPMMHVDDWENTNLSPARRKHIRDLRLEEYNQRWSRQRHEQMERLLNIVEGMNMEPRHVFTEDFLESLAEDPSRTSPSRSL